MLAPGSWFKDWRDRLLSDPRFHRFANAFPLTRRVARREAEAIFDLCAGFVYSQILFACVRLDLFTILAEGPQETSVLARRLDLAEERAARLLAAASALDLTERRGPAWGLGRRGAALLGAPGVAEMINHHEMLYSDLADPIALLRDDAPRTELGAFWGYAGGARNPELTGSDTQAYSELMAASQSMIAEETLAAYPPVRHDNLMDVGGGDGSFLLAAAARAPALGLRLFDLPAVAEIAQRRFEAAELGTRWSVFSGDFLRDPLPEGSDLISLVRVVHDHDDDAVRSLLGRVRKALVPGGTLLLSEPMAGDDQPTRAGDAYFGIYLLAMGAGRPRSLKTLGEMLREAGFASVTERPTRRPFLTRALVATR